MGGGVPLPGRFTGGRGYGKQRYRQAQCKGSGWMAPNSVGFTRANAGGSCAAPGREEQQWWDVDKSRATENWNHNHYYGNEAVAR